MQWSVDELKIELPNDNIGNVSRPLIADSLWGEGGKGGDFVATDN
jgi:hypothetical protein